MSRTNEPPSARFPSPAAAVTADVLRALMGADSAMSVRDLARRVNGSKSTLHRILTTLAAKGFVRRLEDGYELADGWAELASGARRRRLPDLADPVLRDVHRQVGETVNLGVPEDLEMVIIAAVQSAEPLRMVSWVGRRDLMHASALGKAYLASLDAPRRDSMLRKLRLERLTAKTLTTSRKLAADLELTKRRGYAIDDEESVDGVLCVAAAIHDETGEPIAVLSVSAPSARLPKSRIDVVGAIVMRSAENVEALLSAPTGGSDP